MQLQISRSIILVLFASSAQAADYIVGGQPVSDFDPVSKATVGIFDPSPDGHSGALCSGTLIGKDIAVTAAHCVPPGAAKPTVIFGNDLRSPDAVHRQVEAVEVNPRWGSHAGKGMDQGDIALVKFKGSLPDGYNNVPTVGSDKDIQAGEAVTLAGYGISDGRTKTGAGILRKTEVSVLHNRPGKSEMILDQSHGHGACHGDSGGPAFVNQGGKIALAGLTNRSYPNRAPDDCKHQVVYTKIPAYRSWIQKSEHEMETEGSQKMLSRRALMSSHHRLSTSRGVKEFVNPASRTSRLESRKTRHKTKEHLRAQRHRSRRTV